MNNDSILKAMSIPYNTFSDMIRITRHYEDKGFDTELWEDLGQIFITRRWQNVKKKRR